MKEDVRKPWNLEKILGETGDLHKTLSAFLDRYLKGSELHGQVYERTVIRMARSGLYSDETISFYKHCYKSVTAAKHINDYMDKKGG